MARVKGGSDQHHRHRSERTKRRLSSGTMMDYSDFEKHYVGEYLVSPKETPSLRNSRKMAVSRPQVRRSPSVEGRPGKTLLSLSMFACTLAVVCVVAITTIAPRSHKARGPSAKRDVDATEIAGFPRDVVSRAENDESPTASPPVGEDSTEGATSHATGNETEELRSDAQGSDRHAALQDSGADDGEDSSGRV